jgi:chaperonin cofactor prefoldin
MPRSKIRRGRENLRLSPSLALRVAQKRIVTLERERSDLQAQLDELDSYCQLQEGTIRAALANVAEYEQEAARVLMRRHALQLALETLVKASL